MPSGAFASPGHCGLSAPAEWWPTAEVGADLIYTKDVSSDLLPLGDSIEGVVLSVMPSGAGELQPIDISVDGYVITAQLSGGVAGRVYIAQLIVTGVSGYVWPYLIGIAIDPTLMAYPPIVPPVPGFGPPITWAAGLPPALDFAQPLSVSTAAAVF